MHLDFESAYAGIGHVLQKQNQAHDNRALGEDIVNGKPRTVSVLYEGSVCVWYYDNRETWMARCKTELHHISIQTMQILLIGISFALTMS